MLKFGRDLPPVLDVERYTAAKTSVTVSTDREQPPWKACSVRSAECLCLASLRNLLRVVA